MEKLEFYIVKAEISSVNCRCHRFCSL